MATSPHITHVTDASFEREVLQSDKPVLVDFWADWCGPCRVLGPVLEEVAAAHADTARVVKVHVDENPQTAARYGISSIPTVALFKDGHRLHTEIGVRPRQRYEVLLEKITGA